MGKPKASDYKPTAEEIATARVGLAEHNWWRETGMKHLIEFANNAANFNLQGVSVGRAMADFFQNQEKMQGPADTAFRIAKNVDFIGDQTQASLGQWRQGNIAGEQAELSDRMAGHKLASKVQTDAMSGISQAGKIATSEEMAGQAAKTAEKVSLLKAGGKLAEQAIQNKIEYEADKSTYEDDEGNPNKVEDDAGDEVSGRHVGDGYIELNPYANDSWLSGWFGGPKIGQMRKGKR